MFAPWCPTCSRHTLLGPRRIEAVETGPTGPRVVLRCFCDTVLVWSAAAAEPAVIRQPAAIRTRTPDLVS